MLRNPPRIERRAHHHEPQVPPRSAEADEQREQLVRGQVALVKFVQDDEPCALELGRAKQTAQQYALGGVDDARFAPDSLFVPYRVPDALSNGFTQRFSDVMRRQASGDPTRLGDPNLGVRGQAALQPERNARGLSCAGFGLQHDELGLAEQLCEPRHDRIDGKRRCAGKRHA